MTEYAGTTGEAHFATMTPMDSDSLFPIYPSRGSSFEEEGYMGFLSSFNEGDREIQVVEEMLPLEFNGGGTGYGDYFVFNRIWLFPRRFSIGFIVETFDSTITIWNAYLDRSVDFSNFDSLRELGTGVMTPSLPKTINRTDHFDLGMVVFREGPTTQDTIYYLTIDGEVFEVFITGFRVLIFHYPPNWGALPEIEYEFHTTSIITPNLVEQRRALSDESWISISNEYHFSYLQSQKIFNLISFGHDKVFGVPIFSERLNIATLTETSITFLNTDLDKYFNFSTNSQGYIIITDHKNKAEMKQVFSFDLATKTVVFEYPLLVEFDLKYTSAYPVLFAYIKSVRKVDETDEMDIYKIDFKEYKGG
jgi:hypothetical protein